MDHNPTQYLLDAYLGEIGGEATFLAMIEHLPDREPVLQLLAQVEAETASALERYLEEKPDPSVIAEVQTAASARLQNFNLGSWEEMIEAVLPIVEDALSKFIEAEKQAPENLLGIYQTYTAHEQALADFLHLEQAGQDGRGALNSYLTTLS